MSLNLYSISSRIILWELECPNSRARQTLMGDQPDPVLGVLHLSGTASARQSALTALAVGGTGGIAHSSTLDDTHDLIALYAAYLGVFFDVFEFNHAPSLVICLL